MTDLTHLIGRLREGCVYENDRDPGRADIDEDATDGLLNEAADALQSLTANHGEAEEIIAEHKAEVAKLAENDPEFEALMRQRYPVPPYSEKASKASAAKYREAAMLALRENITLAAKVQSLTARVGELEGALGDLVSWFTTPMIDGRVWLIPAGERGANDAVDNARKALSPVEGE